MNVINRPRVLCSECKEAITETIWGHWATKHPEKLEQIKQKENAYD